MAMVVESSWHLVGNPASTSKSIIINTGASFCSEAATSTNSDPFAASIMSRFSHILEQSDASLHPSLALPGSLLDTTQYSAWEKLPLQLQSHR